MVSYKSTQLLSKTDAAYIAGIIDGEGTISDGEGTISLLRKHKNENRQLVISISNTEMPLLSYIHNVIGAGKITSKKTYRSNHTPSYTYTISNRQAIGLLKQIFPFLKTYKYKRAELVLNNYIRVTPRNGKYNDQLRQERSLFVEAFFAIHP